MIKKEYIAALAENFLKGTDQFVVKISVGGSNLINVYIDGDEGVTIDDCVKLSRHIEQGLDRDEEDFELRVSSTGAEEPFVNLRQYRKNTGRTVKIELNDGTRKRGILEAVEEDAILIREEIKKKNKKAKGLPADEAIKINLDQIAKAHVVVTF